MERVFKLAGKTHNSNDYPNTFLKKRRGYSLLQSPPSVCPSARYLLLNHWTKSNQIWCVSCSHECGAQWHIFFGPAPWGPREGPKSQISINIIKFQSQSQFQRFLNQILCVFSQMKDIKHIIRISFGFFGHAPGVGLGGTVGSWGGQNFFSKI